MLFRKNGRYRESQEHTHPGWTLFGKSFSAGSNYKILPQKKLCSAAANNWVQIMLIIRDVKKRVVKKPTFQFLLCLWGFHHQESILVKGNLLVRGVPLAGRVERGFGFACLFYKRLLWKALASSQIQEGAAKYRKKITPKKPFMVLKALSCPVPEGAVNCTAFQLQKVSLLSRRVFLSLTSCAGLL